MRPPYYLIVVLALVFCLQSAVAAPQQLDRRQDESPSPTVEAPSTTARASTQDSTTQTARPSSSREAVVSSSISASASVTGSSTTTASNGPSSPSPSVVTDTDLLPIHPKITPAMGLAGVVMLVSGVLYAVIGIKNKWLYIFASAAYLTSLAVTILIVYLMSPPVSNAVQGAFFVAVFLSGFIFGAVALVFSDITEGLGCLLGGFCLSLWFLTLKADGLITSTTGRAIFIGCMSLGGYALSWSHYTRTYGLIGSISFAGATITMLGADCFSRAGWKEFWLYIFDLNRDIFPLDTNTYPLTRGIKVELAGVVIIAIFGIVSQLKLWRLIKERRETTAAQRAADAHNQDVEEQELGRKIEDELRQEREQWETTYGNKGAQDSLESYATTPKTSTSVREKGSLRTTSVELTPLPKDSLASSVKEATVTVNVLQVDDIQQIDSAGKPLTIERLEPVGHSSGATSSASSARASSDITRPARMSRSISARSSLQPSASPPPVVVHLPFNVPEEDAKSQTSDNASILAIPDIPGAELEPSSNRRSLSNRYSNLPGRKRRSAANTTGSEEALVTSHIDEDRASSIAATLDETDQASLEELSLPHSAVDARFEAEPLLLSVAGDFYGSPAKASSRPSSQFAYEVQAADSSTTPISTSSNSTKETEQQDNQKEVQSPSAAPPRLSLTVSTDPRRPAESRSNPKSLASPRLHSDTVVGGQSQQATSEVSETQQRESNLGNLTGALPGSLSKVAQSYRTNEWAKHLEAAEVPDLDEIPEPGSPGVKVEHERPAPVGAELTRPIDATKRSSKRVSSGGNRASHTGFIRTSSNSLKNAQTDPARGPSAIAAGRLSRSTSQVLDKPARQSINQLPSLAESSGNRLSSAPTPAPDSTLMGQRDTLVRNRVLSGSFMSPSLSTNTLAAVDDQDMTLAQRKRALQHQKPPSASQKWQQKNGHTAGSQVQVGAGFNSHQPKRTTRTGSDQKREDLLAGWRESIRQTGTPDSTTVSGEEQRRAALMSKRQKEMGQQQNAAVVQQRESLRHNMMRSSEMLDAHREAMRKMQSAANKNS